MPCGEKRTQEHVGESKSSFKNSFDVADVSVANVNFPGPSAIFKKMKLVASVLIIIAAHRLFPAMHKVTHDPLHIFSINKLDRWISYPNDNQIYSCFLIKLHGNNRRSAFGTWHHVDDAFALKLSLTGKRRAQNGFGVSIMASQLWIMQLQLSSPTNDIT